jgi:PDZ domain-containing protein
VRKRITAPRLFGAGLLLLAAVAAALWFIPSDSYIFLPDRAKALAPLVHVQGQRPESRRGGIYLVDVLVRRASLLERLWPGIHSGSSIVPVSAFKPPGVSQKEQEQIDLQAMRRSQQVAAAVALRALGRTVRVRSVGVLIAAVVAGTPAVGRLSPGDVIVAVDGRRVRTRRQLRRATGRLEPGDLVHLTLRTSTGLRRVTLRATHDPDAPRRAFIGVAIQDDVRIRVATPVRINTGDIGGPSAGLAFALEIMEELGRNVDRGFRVAATGELAIDGSVEPVGGVKQKTIGARRSRIQVMLVPAGDNFSEAARYAGGMRVLPVRTFGQALHALATLRRPA